jgi:hypothetical protein
MTSTAETKQTGVGLTKAQIYALVEIERGNHPSVRFQTGEALRRKGMVERLTTSEVSWSYADRNGEREQWSGPPRKRHEWFLTSVGRSCAARSRPAKAVSL